MRRATLGQPAREHHRRLRGHPVHEVPSDRLSLQRFLEPPRIKHDAIRLNPSPLRNCHERYSGRQAAARPHGRRLSSPIRPSHSWRPWLFVRHSKGPGLNFARALVSQLRPEPQEEVTSSAEVRP
jgi:hypothetical protein